jgi:hypothetical protein
VNAASFAQTGSTGTVNINGGTVSTSGVQTYGGAVVLGALGASSTLSTSGSAVSFSSTVDNAVSTPQVAQNLTLATARVQ